MFRGAQESTMRLATNDPSATSATPIVAVIGLPDGIFNACRASLIERQPDPRVKMNQGPTGFRSVLLDQSPAIRAMLGTQSKRDSLSADFRLKECGESKFSVVRRASEWATSSVAVVGRSWFAAVVGMAVALSGAPAEAQDLTAGRTPAQLFASGCTACHKSPQGLAKGQSGGALSGFLRQHYTSKPEMADALAGYLASAGNAPAPGGRAGRAAAQEPPGAPGAPGTQPSGRPRATIAV